MHAHSKHVDYLATGLSTQLEDCDSLTAEVHVITIRAQSTTITDMEKERLEILLDRLYYLGTTHTLTDPTACSTRTTNA